MPRAILIKPLDGDPEGTERDFSKADFARLVAMKAVKAAPTRANKAAPTVDNKAAPVSPNTSPTK